VQEYIAEAKGCDIRCLVVGNEVVAAIERRAKEGDFALTCTAAAWPRWRRLATRRAIAIKATQTLGLDVAGVDILRHPRAAGDGGECLARAGRVETTTGVDIASRMIAWIERQATPEFCLKIGG
jgi:ribosomal protein S6--L-glutamate ligase